MSYRFARSWPVLLVCIAAAILAAAPPGAADDDGIDPALEAGLDEILQKHRAKAPPRKDAAPRLAAGRLTLHGERTITLQTPTFVPRDTPRETLQASLAARRSVVLGPWYYAGPFDNEANVGLKTTYPPERAIDLTADYVGLAKRRFGWQLWKGFRDGRENRIDLRCERAWATSYLYRRIAVRRPVELPVVLGCHYPMAVLLNGTEVARTQGHRGFEIAQVKLWLKLRPGDNVLLVKVCGRSGRVQFGWGDHASLRPAVDGMLMERILAEVAGSDPALAREFALQRDWLGWDRASFAKGGPEAAARKVLALARATLAFVARAAPRPKLAAELAELAGQFDRADARTDWQELYLRTRRLRRRIIFSHPLLAFDRLLINKRPPPKYSHMCDQYLGRHSGPGDGLVVLTDWRGDPKARRLLPNLPVGTSHYPDLSCDGRRVLFSFCDHTERDRHKRRFWIYEANLDDGTVRQITGAPGRDPMEGQDGRKTVLIEDWDPCYLPGGDIVFISTRNQGFGRCHGGRYTPSYVLYRCSPDGGDIRRISWGEANEWDPSVLHDGRVVYTRWDYINRHDTVYQSLWTTRPDGSATAHFYGNNSRNPCMIAEARAIPGSHRVVATTMGHHSYTAGSIVVIDPLKGFDGMAPIRRITPETRFPETEGWPTGVFCTPWPLSEELFVAAYTPDRIATQGRVQRENAYGIYLVDALGGRELIYRDPNMSCLSPIPIQPRPEPPAVASSLSRRSRTGVFFLHDVYASGDLCREPIPPGKARYLRVVGIIGQPIPGAPTRSVAGNEIVKWVIGTVPLDDRGCAAFHAPANVPLLFQVLDENHMAVMAMRSQAYLQPGESMSCVGCHEPAGTTAPLRASRSLAVREIAPPPGPRYEGGFSFARTVQPVLDRYCIRCHGLGGEAPADPAAAAAAELHGRRPSVRVSKMSLLGTHTGRFSEAYEALTKNGGVRVAHRNGEAVPSRPKDYGSHASKLAPMLLAGHKGRARLDADSFRRVAAWLDLNVQYYGDYDRRRPERRRPDKTGERALRQHLRARCTRCHKTLADQPFAALVNLACPDESRLLRAKLPAAAGGWAQCKDAFAGAADEQYRLLREKVLAAAGPATLAKR